MAATVLAAAIGFGGPTRADAATVTRTGSVSVLGTVTISSAVPTSTTISAAVELSTYDSTSLDSQALFANATVKRSGNTGTVSIVVPYTFIFDAARVKSATLVATVTIYADTTQVYGSSGPLSVPTSGTKTPVTVHLAL